MLTLLAGISAFPLSAQALDCTATPDCATLGYTLSAADCTDKPTVKCPTDSSKIFCKKDLKPVTCAVGSVLGNDKLCYNATEIPNAIKPIGIVFDASNKLAMALTDVKEDGSAGSGEIKWSEKNCDIPNLENCSSSSTVVTTCAIDGRANSNAILATNGGCSGKTYAANAANAYSPSGCATAFCKAGRWYLPSFKDLYTIYNAMTTLKQSITALSSYGAAELRSNYYYWSSTEMSATKAWDFAISTGSRNNAVKASYGFNVRPVLYYGDETSMPILYGDGTVSNTILSDKTPVGIVFDTTNKLAIALNDTGSSMKWSVGYCDVSSLTNCSSASTISSCGVDGPAQAVKAYNLGSSCTATFCKQGNWFVPSARDLQTIKNNKEVLNASLTQVGGATLSGSYWASTEYSQVDAWKMEMSTNTLNFDDKVDTVAKVRPVVKYVLPSLDESGGGI